MPRFPSFHYLFFQLGGCQLGPAARTASPRCAAALGHGSILLVGDAPYYARFGFSAELTRKLKMPAPVLRKRFLGLELTPGALTGAAGKVVGTGLPANLPALATAALRRVA